MGLDATIRSGIGIIDSVTKSLQGVVIFSGWTGQNMFGEGTFASGINYNAIIEPMHKIVHLQDGRIIRTMAKVLVLEEMAITVGSSERSQPVDNRDKFVLPDGRTGPIVSNPGLTDPTTNRPYFAEVTLGAP